MNILEMKIKDLQFKAKLHLLGVYKQKKLLYKISHFWTDEQQQQHVQWKKTHTFFT